MSARNSQYDLAENLRGYDFPIANLLGHVPVTKMRVHFFSRRRKPILLPSTHRNLSLGAPDNALLAEVSHPNARDTNNEGVLCAL